MEKAKCRKCGKYDYVEKHHVVPQGILKDGETVQLCPNCHTKYHIKLGRKNLKNHNFEFYWKHYLKWINGLLLILILIGIYWGSIE